MKYSKSRQSHEKTTNDYAKTLLKLKHTLRFNENGKFKIVIISDIQDNYPMQEDTLAYMNIILDQEEPDLVLLGGDNHCGGIASEEILDSYFKQMSEPMESRMIPWGHVYGNHALLKIADKNRQEKFYESFPYNVAKAGNVYGQANYVLPVLRSDSNQIAFNIFALDSQNYLKFAKEGPELESKALLDNPIYGWTKQMDYETIHFDQVRWYWNASNALEGYNNAPIPAMMIFHIPLYEFEAVPKNPEQTGMIGSNADGVSPPELSSGLFGACYERGDVKAIFVGHCHKNDFVGTYMGIKLVFTPTIGSYQYNDPKTRGVRVIEIDQNDAANYTSRMVYCKDLELPNN